MLHALKWLYPETRSVSYPDEGGGGSEAAPSPSGGAGDGGGANGGASAPASSPAPGGEGPGGGSATPPGAAPASAPPIEGFDWGALGSSDDLDYIPVPAETPPVVAPVVPPTATPPTGVSPAAATPPAAPQAQPPQAQPTGAEGQGAAPLSAADPMGIAAGLEANRDAIVAHLAQSKFALSEADIKDLDTDVTVAVPKLLARVFLESQVSMQKFLAQAVPGMVQRFNRVTSANDGAERKFFDTHRALDRNNPQHRDAVVRMATVYRQANPSIPLDQLIQEVGPMVMTALRVNAAVAQAKPASPRGGIPFTPAVNGGGGISPTAEPINEWMGLGQNYDSES